MPSDLGKCNIVAFVNVVDVDRARAFYRDTLGLQHVGDELPYALVFDANGIMLRLAIVKERPLFPGTILGWNVPDAVVAVQRLQKAGVQFERYGFLKQDELGIWTTPTGAKVAWFKDPDGNVLSVSEHPEQR
ncbi:MAG TPA: glyoxalase superfamily protein [Bryobacteraceae bacterium]|nr:glyoxalase superfamily protein [Bryobacteraceae bacterium]